MIMIVKYNFFIIITCLILITSLLTIMVEINKITSKTSLPTSTEVDPPTVIYNTDNITVPLRLWSPTGAGMGTPGFLLETNDTIVGTLFLSEHIATDRSVKFTLIWYHGDGLVIDGELSIWRNPSDGLTAVTTIENGINHDITFGAVNTFIESTYTLAITDLVADCVYRIGWKNVDASTIYITSIQADYLVKRS